MFFLTGGQRNTLPLTPFWHAYLLAAHKRAIELETGAPFPEEKYAKGEEDSLEKEAMEDDEQPSEDDDESNPNEEINES